jgi:2-dehydro-3-deoxyphosphogalactonate aldolase
MSFYEHFGQLPLIAILRGLPPEDAVKIGEALVEAGFRLLEVPLNSPEPFSSISLLGEAFAGEAAIGAGTVMSEEEVRSLVEADGDFVVMPHSDPKVIAAAKASGLACLPGTATPTEAFAAVAAGADGLKMFPAEVLPPPAVKAWRAVLPKGTLLLPVGGITPGKMAEYVAAGASGFGLGSALYRPGDGVDRVRANAVEFVAAWCAIEDT